VGVQAKRAYHNGNQNVLPGWFTAEYGWWFGYLLPGRMGTSSPLALGGSSNHFRTAVLRRLGGWDPYNVTEDADLGIRLSIEGARVRIVYDDEFVTREETPHTIEQFIKQRTRWNQGFIQILFKGIWLKLPTLQKRLLALYVLNLPEVQSFFALMLPVSVAMFFFAKLPVWMALLTFMPLYCFILSIFIESAGLHEFLRVHKRKWRWREVFILILAFFPYQFVLGLGAIRAIFRSIKGTSNWEKTAHIGQHRKAVA